MYYIVKREKVKRKIVLKKERKRILLRSIWQNRQISFALRYLVFLEIMGMEINSNKNRLKNRCIETGRSRSILREFHISRLRFRERMRRGEMPGVRKSSW